MPQHHLPPDVFELLFALRRKFELIPRMEEWKFLLASTARQGIDGAGTIMSFRIRSRVFVVWVFVWRSMISTRKENAIAIVDFVQCSGISNVRDQFWGCQMTLMSATVKKKYSLGLFLGVGALLSPWCNTFFTQTLWQETAQLNPLFGPDRASRKLLLRVIALGYT